MTIGYSILASCQRVFAITESITAAALNRASYTRSSARLLPARRAVVSARASSNLTCMPLYFDYIRSLKRRPRRHHLVLLDYDLAPEGRDFFIWKIDISGGLTRSEYESMRDMAEHELNQDVSNSREEIAPGTQQKYPDRLNTLTEAPSSPIQRDAIVKVVAMYDTDVEDELPTECLFFFSWPADGDPVATYKALRHLDGRFISLSKAVPLLDALQGAGSATTSELAQGGTKS